jgi:hypothetical protein
VNGPNGGRVQIEVRTGRVGYEVKRGKPQE